MVFAPPAAIGGDGRDALRRALDARQPQGGRAVAYSQPVDGGSAPSSRSDICFTIDYEGLIIISIDLLRREIARAPIYLARSS